MNLFSKQKNTERKEVLKYMMLRTIPQFVRIVKEKDNESAINESLVRRLVNEGVIPSIKQGNRRILDVDTSFTALEKMINDSNRFTPEIKTIKTDTTPNAYSLNQYERAQAKIPKINIA